MKRLAIPLLLVTCVSILAFWTGEAPAQERVRLTGSGASFPFPLYSAWFKSFSSKHGTVSVDYQAKGSGAGIQDFINHTVDFAASDAAMTDEEIAKIPGGVQLVPLTAGEIALAYNVAGVKGLKLPRDVYSGIFLGKITNILKRASFGFVVMSQKRREHLTSQFLCWRQGGSKEWVAFTSDCLAKPFGSDVPQPLYQFVSHAFGSPIARRPSSKIATALHRLSVASGLNRQHVPDSEARFLSILKSYHSAGI